jgi:hypothetical protein
LAEVKITEVRPLLDIDARGRFVKKYRVSFTVDGIEDWVDIPEEEFSAERAKELVNKKAEEVRKLMKG